MNLYTYASDLSRPLLLWSNKQQDMNHYMYTWWAGLLGKTSYFGSLEMYTDTGWMMSSLYNWNQVFRESWLIPLWAELVVVTTVTQLRVKLKDGKEERIWTWLWLTGKKLCEKFVRHTSLIWIGINLQFRYPKRSRLSKQTDFESYQKAGVNVPQGSL